MTIAAAGPPIVAQQCCACPMSTRPPLRSPPTRARPSQSLAIFAAGGSGGNAGAGSAGSLGDASVSQLARLSLGNLGGATAVCGAATEGDGALTLTCPPGAHIGRVEATFGAPTGVCACPPPQVPGPYCPGAPDASGGGGCMPPGSFCHVSPARPIPLPSGDRVYGGACCAAALAGGKPDFSALDIRSGPAGCDAAHGVVRAVASGVCLGAANCTLATGRDVVQTWTAAPRFGTDCGAGAAVCGSSWGAGGGLGSCNASAALGGLRLVVVARCYEPLAAVSWLVASTPTAAAFAGGGGDSREAAALVSMAATALGALVFLCGAWLLHVSETAPDGDGRPRLTAAHYTIMLGAESLPPHTSLEELEAEVRTHFETVLNGGGGRGAGLAASGRHRHHIADVNFGLKRDRLLELFNSRGQLLVRMERQGKVALILEAERRDRCGRTADAGGAGALSLSRSRAAAALADVSLRLTRQSQFVDRLAVQLAALDAEIDVEEARSRSEAAAAAAAAAASAADRSARSPAAPPTEIQPSSAPHGPPRVAAAAFVTFERDASAARALGLYPASALRWYCQPRWLRIGGVTRVWLRRPAEPSDVRWENFALGPGARRLRQAASLVVILGCLVAGAQQGRGGRRLMYASLTSAFPAHHQSVFYPPTQPRSSSSSRRTSAPRSRRSTRRRRAPLCPARH